MSYHGYNQQQGYGQQMGGYHQQSNVPPGCPPGVDPTIFYWFQSVDQDRSGRISAAELKTALMNNKMQQFNDETCRMMIGMFDTNRDGQIDIREFAALWNYIQQWRKCFDSFDTDRSGNIDCDELSRAFHTFGYRLSPQFSRLVVQRFDRANQNTIDFDDFIQVCVMLQVLTGKFRSKDTNQTGKIRVHYEEFLEMVIDNTMNMI